MKNTRLGSVVAIPITDESYERIEKYANKVGIPLHQAATEALEEWMDSTGDELVLFIQQQEQRFKQKAKTGGSLRLVTSER